MSSTYEGSKMDQAFKLKVGESVVFTGGGSAQTMRVELSRKNASRVLKQRFCFKVSEKNLEGLRHVTVTRIKQRVIVK